MVAVLKRQLCWAHLKRDFQKFKELGGEARKTGNAGLRAVTQIFSAWSEWKEKRIERAELQAAKRTAQAQGLKGLVGLAKGVAASTIGCWVNTSTIILLGPGGQQFMLTSDPPSKYHHGTVHDPTSRHGPSGPIMIDGRRLKECRHGP